MRRVGEDLHRGKTLGTTSSRMREIIDKMPEKIMMLTWVGDDVNVSVLYQLATVFVVSHHAASFPYSIPGGMFHEQKPSAVWEAVP